MKAFISRSHRTPHVADLMSTAGTLTQVDPPARRHKPRTRGNR
jgi:hypothetical protein